MLAIYGSPDRLPAALQGPARFSSYIPVSGAQAFSPPAVKIFAIDRNFCRSHTATVSISEASLRSVSLYWELLDSQKADFGSVDDMLERNNNYVKSATGLNYQLYIPLSGGGYREAVAGETAEYVKRNDGVYVHISQVFQPTAAARRRMDMTVLILGVTLQTTRGQLAYMDAYLTELEKHNATLRNLQNAYQRCTILQTNLNQEDENSIGVVDSEFLQSLQAAGVLDINDGSKFITGIAPPTITVEWDEANDGGSSHWDYDCTKKFYLYWDGDTLAARGENYYNFGSDENAIMKFYSYGMIDLEMHIEASGKYIGWHDYIAKHSVRVLVNGNATYGPRSGGYLDDGGDDYDPNAWTDRSYGNENRRYAYGIVHYNYLNTQDYMATTDLKTIVNNKMKAYMPRRNLRSYMDTLRVAIDNENNRMQIHQTALGMVTKDMNASFSLASNLIKDLEERCLGITRNVR
jgi:hypothetical protein